IGKIRLAQAQGAKVELRERPALRRELHEEAQGPSLGLAALKQPDAALPSAGRLYRTALGRIEALAVFQQDVFAGSVLAEEHGAGVIVAAEAEYAQGGVRAGVHEALAVGAALARPLGRRRRRGFRALRLRRAGES